MAVDEGKIEALILEYIRSTSGMNELPNRHNAIRDVTGQLEVLPSAVAKVITKMIEAKTIRHLKSTDKLEIVD
jgi:DNA-binding MarR family transcriptional regulator